MPELSRFYGIIITMNYNEYNPPHFHATYQGYEISVEIKTALKMIFEWLDIHKDELLDDWQLAQDRKALIIK